MSNSLENNKMSIDQENIQLTTDGEANFYGIADGKNWILRVQINGTLDTKTQLSIMENIINSLKNM